ncbi:MAG: hypothetical protein INQ03_01870 [Candidatus Heimdallarchaeota archaeon]|nr:hypothetical protein [Candidatus Heimdallarchaeota archaeon]
MVDKITIIKLGGASITDKTTHRKANTEAINHILKQLDNKSNIILVHGAGSFGHIIAKQYMLRYGVSDNIDFNEQREGIVQVRQDLNMLGSLIHDAAYELGLFPFILSVPSLIVTKGEDHAFVAFNAVSQALETGFIPILSGDICFDSSSKFRVISGDRIIKMLSEYFIDKYEVRVIFGTDTDGLYDKDPSKNEDAKLITSITHEEIYDFMIHAGESAGIDITGGMLGKMQQIYEISKLGVDVIMANITKENRLLEILNNNEAICTKINSKV